MEICKKNNDLKLDWLFIDGVIGEPHDESLFTHEYFIKTAQQRFDDFEEMVVGLLKKQHGDISESFVGEQFNWHELVGDETVSVENEFIPLLVSFLNEGEVKTIYEGIKNGEVVINIFNEPIIKVFEWICETKAESDYESEQEYESDKGNDAARGSLKFYKDENWASRKKMLNVIASHRLLNDLTISTQISVIKGMQQS